MHITIVPSVKASFFDGFIFFKLKQYTGFGAPAVVEFLKRNPDALVTENLPAERILKKKSNIVYTVSPDNKVPVSFTRLIVKKCLPRNVLHLLLSPFYGSKAMRSYSAARHLIAHGLDTPRPLAYMEKRKGGFVTESYYITAMIENCVKVKQFVRKNSENVDDIQKVMQAVADYATGMHTFGMVHRDLNLANFLLSSEDDDHRLALIDLNRYRIRKRISSFGRVFDIGRLYWGKYRSEFFRIYCGDDKKLLRWEWYFDLYYLWRKKRRRFKKWIKGKNK